MTGGMTMKRIAWIALALILYFHPVLALDKDDFDLQEQQGLLKSVTTSSIANYGSHLATTEKLEYSLITGGYFTIGTLSGSSTSTLDDNCGISFGHPYAMTSYPLLGIDGAWEKFDILHSPLGDLSPQKNQDTLRVRFTHNAVLVDFLIAPAQSGAALQLALTMKNTDTQNHSCGGAIVFDPALGRNGDGALFVNEQPLAVESVLSSAGLNSSLAVYERNSLAKGMGVSLSLPDKPSRLIAANWPDILNNSTPQHTITQAKHLYDLVLKLVWDEITMTPGQTRSLSATIALAEADFSAPVFLRWNLPTALTLSNNVLFPKDLTGALQCINTTHNNYNNARLLFDSPYEVYTDAEFVDLTIPAAGLYTPLELHSREIYEEKIVKFCIICTHNGAVLDSLSRYIYIPATPVSDTGLLVTIDSLITSSYPDVNIIFSGEVEETGQKLLNLRKENIFLYENNSRILSYDLEKFQGGGSALADIVFVLDVSGSMGDEINQVRNYLGEFADSLVARDFDYQIGVVTFSTTIDLVIDMTKDINFIKTKLSQINLWGGVEDSPAALYRATQLSLRPGSKRNIIWVTDEEYPETSYTKTQIVNRMLEMDFRVHGVGPLYLQTTWFNPIVLPTGGNFYDITGNFRDILLDVSRMKVQDKYSLTYKSPGNIGANTIRLQIHYAGLGGETTTSYSVPTFSRIANALVCYPNPFNPEVKININASQESVGQVGIYNLLGQKIRQYELYKNSPRQIIWNASDEQGLPVSSGVYIVLLELHDKDGNKVSRESQKILYLK